MRSQIERSEDVSTTSRYKAVGWFCIHTHTCYNARVKFLYPMLVVLLAVFAVAPLEYPGAIQSQTGLLTAYNLISLDQAPLQVFNWAPTVGRTYDLFRTDGALAYVPAEFFHLIGIGFLDATKLVIALAWIASGLAMYALARRFLSQAGALLASAVYVNLPFHIATVYVRGAFAESVAWAIFPLALLAAIRAALYSNTLSPAPGSRSRQALSLMPFAFLFLILPGLAILFGLVSLAMVAAMRWTAREQQPTSLSGALLVIFGGLALGGLLYIPTVARYGATIVRDGFSANYVYPFQLFSSLWGFGASSGSFLDQFPLQVGVVPIGLAIIALALGWHSTNQVVRRAAFILIGAGAILAILTFEVAAPLWNLFGALVAYPWQLLAFVGFALALAAGSAVEFDTRLTSPAMLAFFVALPIVATYSYLAPRYTDIAPTRPNIAIFGRNEIALLDYRIVGPLQHGATVRVNTVWQALRPIDHDYTVFVHAVDADGKTWAQLDTKPQEGELPTIKWQPGQVVADTYTIQIDVDGPREGYQLEFGLYVEATGARALTDAGKDHLLLPRLGDPAPTITDQLPPSQQ